MKIYVCTHIWNEERILPYFLRHYSTFADWIFVYDQNSTDNSVKLIRQCPRTSVLALTGIRQHQDIDYVAFAAREYPLFQGTADWVLWPDADEILYHPNIRTLLAKYLAEGVQVPLTQGYQMIAKKFPSNGGQIYDEIKTGFASDVFCKPIVFTPNSKVQWVPGKHRLESWCKPKRNRTPEIKLLHYRFIDPGYVQERNRRNWERMDDLHRRMGHNWTCNPAYSGMHSYRWYDQIKDKKLANVV